MSATLSVRRIDSYDGGAQKLPHASGHVILPTKPGTEISFEGVHLCQAPFGSMISSVKPPSASNDW